MSETGSTPLRLRHRFRQLAGAEGLLSAMRTLNAAVPYRYSAIFRFEGDVLRNVCLVDKLDPDVTRCDDQAISDSYCIFIRRSGRIFNTENSIADERVAEHPKRAQFRSYYGIPILADDGGLLGTACHFDMEPVRVGETVVTTLDEVADAIAEALSTGDDTR